MPFNPTKAQLQAINENGNILVSAAAGSGKTAVLVERVIKKLCDNDNPIFADELLIVTFTNAAAAEMRSRIERRLDEECRKDSLNSSLLLQKHRLYNAKICTIDSFCIDLVRENFDKLNISPDFKIGDDSDLNEINEEVLYSIINRYFEEKSQPFIDLLDLVGSEFDEGSFAELLFSVYNYTRQLPFPEKWYDFVLNSYNKGVFDKENIWYEYAFTRAKETVISMSKLIDSANELISFDEKAMESYSAVFSDAKKRISELSKKAASYEWNTFYEALSSFNLTRLPTVRGLSGVTQIDAAKDIYKYLNGKAIETLDKLFYADFEFINSQFKKIYPSINLFIDILKEFEEKLFEAYKSENLFTFHNTEHLALKLLCSEKDGLISVSENAVEILEQYKEVLVDEYQDTNDLQNMLFHVLSGYDEKLFVVGDVKQSIYAFRGANPMNFLEKKNRAVLIDNAVEGDPKKIILGNNFRSRTEICDFINYFFSIFMQKETGSLVYDREEELIPAANFPEIDCDAVSFDIIDSGDNEEGGIVLEARRIADFIKKTINGSPCIKLDDNTLRKANYGDFTILLRNVATKAPQLVEELKKQGIPVNLSVGSFADSLEVSIILSLLKVIDNPQNDIELLTVLMSPIFGFSADEMSEIRINKKDGNLYSAVIYAANNGNLPCKLFLERLEIFRMHSVTLPLQKLLMWLLTDTEYLNIVSAMSEGEKRKGNLLLLCDYATSFSQRKNSSLSAFADYISKLNVSAAASSEDAAVSVMTIHASKGLQFPICIIASTSSKFSDAESRSVAAYSSKLGFGLKYFDEELHQKFTTLPREVILDDIKQSALEEELRLLYVAMTRAQDRLHFVASFSNLENSLKKYNNLLISSNSTVDKGLFLRTKSYADWLILACLLNPLCRGKICFVNNIIPIETESSIEVSVVSGEKLLESEKFYDYENIEADQKIVSDLGKIFEFEYPFKAISNVQSKVSVSVLANKAESDKFSFTSKPSFMGKDGISPTGRGTAMHKVMQFFDFKNSDSIEDEIDRLYEWEFISETERNALDLNALKRFFASEIFTRIKKSERVEREMRFLTEVPVCSIDNSLCQGFEDEKIVVQGAVDICFIENNELVILDFKTDWVDDIQELVDNYSEQLNVYALACEKIFKLKVKEKLIYSFQKSDIVSIK